jgi:hypothetical protein
MPRAILPRSAVLAIVGAPIVAGIHATAFHASADVEAALLWIAAAAVGTAALTPFVLRAILWALVRSTLSIAAVHPVQSVILIGLVLIAPLSDPRVAAEILVSAAPAFGALFAIIVILGVYAWTFGLRPADERPGWFNGLGLVGWTLAVVIGVLSVIGAVAG